MGDFYFRKGAGRVKQHMDGLWYSRQSALFPHLLGAEVCMAAGTVPVPWDWFGVK